MTEQTNATSLPALEGAVIELDEDMSNDQVIHLYNAVQFAKQKMREIDKHLKEGLIEWINRNGDLTIGEQRFYVASVKKSKCLDTGKLVQSFLENHSVEDMVDCLSSQPFKHGECKGRLGEDDYYKHFITETVQDVKTGKPKKQINCVDTKFIK